MSVCQLMRILLIFWITISDRKSRRALQSTVNHPSRNFGNTYNCQSAVHKGPLMYIRWGGLMPPYASYKHFSRLSIKYKYDNSQAHWAENDWININRGLEKPKKKLISQEFIKFNIQPRKDSMFLMCGQVVLLSALENVSSCVYYPMILFICL